MKFAFAFFVITVISACAVWPVGSDSKGRELKTQGASVLEALSRFKQERGHLPASLSELVPGYLPAIPPVPELHYSEKSGSIEFVYKPSWPQLGQISCSAEAGAKEWDCVGYI